MDQQLIREIVAKIITWDITIEKTLKKFNSNRRRTAKALNISERTLYRKINEYGIDKKKNGE